MANETQTTDSWRADVQEAVNILLSDDRPTHEAVVLLRRALGQTVWGDPLTPKRATFPASEVGFTLKDETAPQRPAFHPKPGRHYFD